MNTPVSLDLFFLATVLLTLFWIYKATLSNRKFLGILSGYLIFQSILGISGFYTNTQIIPPRMIFLIGPAVIGISLVFISKKGRDSLMRLNDSSLLLLHTVRIPVELSLYGLFVYKNIPELMTFEGINYDIFSGLSAPLIWWVSQRKTKTSSLIVFIWNIACLILLGIVVFHGILSVPTPFQQFSFEQPNIGMLYFPYLLLPGCVVPLVLFSHLVLLRKYLIQVR